MTAISDLCRLREIIEGIRRYAASHRPAKSGKGGRRPRADDDENPRLHEPQTKGVMIEPVLAWMGWGSADDPDSLWREFPVPNGQVDYVCRAGRRPCLTIEAKKPDLNLRDRKSVTQACGYALSVNAPYAILTDGLVWGVFDIYARKLPVDKLVRKIDLRTCSTEDALQFFRHLTKARALEGDLKVPAAPTNASKTSRKARKKAKARRVSLKSPAFRRHVNSIGGSFGGDLLPVESSRNTFMSTAGQKVRFCASGGDEPMFNLGADNLDVGHVYLVQDGVSHGWMIPADLLRRYFAEGGLGDRKSWTFKVASSEEGDVLWINRTLPALLLTPHRHEPGHA
ncbi:hypothetical protein [Rhizobium leguminosarum]|uniref:hypothetical protein n=1 Tax=Rhizobium leguminosarum TaxID=384 RepID=UPI002E13BE66|nr:hypothetical protein U8Q02_43555 [Rhizobium leguminosarum]